MEPMVTHRQAPALVRRMEVMKPNLLIYIYSRPPRRTCPLHGRACAHSPAPLEAGFLARAAGTVLVTAGEQEGLLHQGQQPDRQPRRPIRRVTGGLAFA